MYQKVLKNGVVMSGTKSTLNILVPVPWSPRPISVRASGLWATILVAVTGTALAGMWWFS